MFIKQEHAATHVVQCGATTHVVQVHCADGHTSVAAPCGHGLSRSTSMHQAL